MVRSSLHRYSEHIKEYEKTAKSMGTQNSWANGNHHEGGSRPSHHVLNFLDIPAAEDIFQMSVPFLPTFISELNDIPVHSTTSPSI